MKKVLFTICLAFVLCATCLTGCSLWSRNDAAYYNQVVAEAGDVQITMKELIYAYNSFGYQYTENGSTMQESVEKTLDELLDKKIFLSRFEKDSSIILTQGEKNYLLSQTHKAINNSIQSYESQVKVERGALSATSPEESATKDVYNEYDETISFINNEFVYNQDIEPLKTLDQTPSFAFTSYESTEIKNEARRRYFEALRESAKILGNKNLDNEQLLKDEIARVYDTYVESALITKINNRYLETFNGSISSFNNEIYDYFKRMVSYEKMNLSIKGVTNTSIGTLKVSDIESLNYYCPNIVSENFFEVVHILIPFNDSYADELADREKLVEAGQIDQSAIDNFKSNAQANLSIAGRNSETGERTEAEITPSQLISMLNTDFIGKTDTEKQNIFREYMFKYTSDDATLTSEANYVIPTNSSLDTMVAEFAAESRRLHDLGQEYAVGSAMTQYGCHIIMYLGEVDRIADENTEISESTDESLVKALYNMKLKSGHNKSAYHKIYEKIISNIDTFDTYFESCVEAQKLVITQAGNKIIIYTKRIKSLWE